MFRDRIKPGTRVKWTAPGGGLREYSGETSAFIPAGADPAFSDLTTCAWDRYLVRCADRIRVVSAALLERQNPEVPRG